MIESAENLAIALHAATPMPFDAEAESNIDREIASLWSAHTAGKEITQRTKVELSELRRRLGQRLSEMKRILVCTGRGGGWAAYLRSHRLPRATADRCVSRHDALMTSPKQNCLSEAIPEPTLEDVTRLVSRLMPTLRRILTTEQLVSDFIHQVVQQLSEYNRRSS